MRRLALATLALLAASAAQAQSEPGREHRHFRAGTRAFDMTADFITYERAGDLYVARGEVQVAQDGRVLTADWAAFSNVTRKGMAIGNVIAREGDDVIHARAMRFQLDEQVGLVLGGRIESETQEFRLEGAEIERRGEDQYRLVDARFTTCQCPEGERDPWVVSSEELDVEIGGFAKARNSTIDILGVPVLWLPWLAYPVKTKRETGLLFPEVRTSSRSGFDIGVPFFWAAADPLNVKIAPHYLVERGFKPELTLEYVIGEKSWGELYGTFLWNDDEVKHNDPTDPTDNPSTPFSNDRWAIDLTHDQHDLPGGWRAKVDATVLSDNLFPFDFREYSGIRNDRHIDSLAFAENSFGARDQLGLSGEVRFADDLQNPDNLDRDSTLLQRVPDLRASLLPSGVLGSRIFWAFDARYTYFTAFDRVHQRYPGAPLGPRGLFLDTGIDGVPTGFERDENGDPFNPLNPPIPPLTADFSNDDFALTGGPEGDGIFQEGELLADRGHRVVLNPRLYAPLRLGDIVEILPELGYYGTFYDSQQRGAAMRNLATGSIDVRARLRRSVPLPFTTLRATHLLEPRIGFTLVEQLGGDPQSDNPLFIPRSEILQARLRALDPTSISRDPADRIDEVEALHLSLGNRLYTRGAEEGAPPRLVADATLTAWWDFKGDTVRNIFLDGAVFPALKWRSRFNLGFDIDDAQIDESLFELGYADDRGDDVSFGYRFVRDLPKFFEGFSYDRSRYDEFSVDFKRINQFDIYGRWTLLRGFAATYRVQYSLEGHFSLRHQFGLEYVSRCKCWAIRIEAEDERSRGFDVGFSYKILGVGDNLIRPFDSRRRRDRDSILTH
jgi:lipopolysaccharide assembly outer membrane protein LptD (OstA)